jgi:phosphohistidine phosphatase
MEHEELLPDLILSSTAHRASQTTVLVKKASGYEGDVLYTDTLYHADTEEILASLREVADEHASVMIVGHNPDLECLVEDLTGEWERLPTAALVEIRLPIEAWAELDDGVEGALARIWIPREVTL